MHKENTKKYQKILFDEIKGRIKLDDESLKFKDKDGKNYTLHTLNGSSLALPRVMAGLIENNQSENGIIIPDVLVPYTGFDIIN